MSKYYKCFKKGCETKINIGKIYHFKDGKKFDNDEKGYYACERLEDTLRAQDAMNKEVDIAKVICWGVNAEYRDDIYEFYNTYDFENMLITEIMTREEIIKYGLELNEVSVKRFLSLFRLTEEEIILFKEKFKNDGDVISTIEYYQEGNEKAFEDYYRRVRVLK
ncbi:MAG: hypothetical protein IKI04_00100 [Bacilli bacterium]|nr:hypothetical protein [Bacilli bacterium]